MLYSGSYQRGGFRPILISPYTDTKQQEHPRWAKPKFENEPVYEHCDVNGALTPGFLYKIPKGSLLLPAAQENTLAVPVNGLPYGNEEMRAKDDDYIFVPDLGGIIIDMAEYLKHYDPQKSRRIHNLSGEIQLMIR